MRERSERILKAIKAKGLSYADLERITGVSKSALQRYATGQTAKIPIDVIEKIASATGVSSRYLMCWDDDTQDFKFPDSDILGLKPVTASNKLVSFVTEQQLSDDEMDDVIDFINFLKSKREKNG